MKKLVKPISILLVIVYLLTIPLSALASTVTVGTSEAYTLMNKWKGYGALDKGTTAADLNKPIQKIDFIMLINSLLKTSKQADIGFSDVPGNSWYGAEIAKAVAAGYIENKDKENYKPFTDITRLDAALMAVRVFGLELKDSKLMNKVTDAGGLSQSDLSDFAAVIENGGLSEISAGRYAPTGVLKLVDALRLLDDCAGQVVSKAGTITKDVPGNMLINAGAVTLKDIDIKGSLTIAEGVGNGDVKLDNVNVNGKLIIRGGGPNSITLANSRVSGSMVVEKSAGNVHVVASGNTTISDTQLKSGCSLEEGTLTGYGSGFLNVTAGQAVEDGQVASLKGAFSNIKTDGSNIDIKLNGNVDNVSISKDSDSSFTLTGGEAKTISTLASKSTIDILGGTVTTLNVESGAKGNKITVNGSTTVKTLTAKENTTINFTKGTIEKLTLDPAAKGSYVNLASGAVLKNFIANAPATVTGSGKIENAYIYANDVIMGIRPSGIYISNGTVTNPGNPSLPDMPISNPNPAISLTEGETANAGVSGPSGSSYSYISSDNSIATVSSNGVITGVSVGTTKIHVTVQNPANNAGVATIEVTVTSGNITKAGTLTINPASGETGTSKDFTLTYKPGDNMSNGTVVIKLPTGFSAYDTDTVSISGGAEKALDRSQRPNSQTLSFTNLNLKTTDTIVVNLKNKLIPTGGVYEFTAVSDADGQGIKLPTSDGAEKAVFTSNKLKVLQIGDTKNYSQPEKGSAGGTTKISKLSFIGLTGATKWIVKVQAGQFAVPNFDDVITGTEYKQGDNITAAGGQHLLLAAVDDNSKVKGYADITLDGGWVRPYDAGQLVPGTNYNTPVTGVEANTTRFNGLKFDGLDTGAVKWMVKVQNYEVPYIFIDTVFDGTAYTSGDGIGAYDGQYIVLAAVDSGNKVKAYADIKVTSGMVSLPAGKLVQDNNFSTPAFGSAVGTTKIGNLNKGSLPGGFADINKWMIAIIDNAAVEPASDVPASEYEKYTGGKTFSEYMAGSDIAIADGKHLILIGVDGTGGADKIKAYADLTMDSTEIRQADAPQIPDGNFMAPVMGSKAGTTMLPDLNFNTAVTDAVKYMYAIQDTAPVAPLQLNSMLSGAKDCFKNQDITISNGQHLILLATDANGRIKAYKDIAVNDTQIRPGDAMKLLSGTDYTLPKAGVSVGTTSIVLSSKGVPGFVKWMYKTGDTAFGIPYLGSSSTGFTDYTSGDDITVNVGQHILVVAVGSTGNILAYTDEAISYEQIRQPLASILKSSSEVSGSEIYNYSIPVPGQSGGTTRITTLNTMGIQGAVKWLYKISDTPVTTPDFNSIVSGLIPYIAGDSISVANGQHFVLYAADSNNKIKAFRDIVITQDQIRTPNAAMLVLPTNYSAPVQGSTGGMTAITSLSFAGLDGADDINWKWRYVVGDTAFIAPTKDYDSNTITGIQSLTKGQDIAVKGGQYILLLAVDGSGLVKGYANIYVANNAIRPYDAPAIPTDNFTLAKGISEGSTSFSKLDFIGLIGATNWMYKVQQGAFDVPAKDMAVTGSALYNAGSDIKITVGWHLLLLATDSLNRVKAYADITVTQDQIQAPFAIQLTQQTNYTDPEPGSAAGTTKIMLNDTGIPKTGTETIAWKYKIGTTAFATPHLDDDASIGYTPYASYQDIPAQAGNVVLIVATINDKIKAYKQFTISSSQIRPANAADLVENYNYTGPVAGSAPGTTKINDLKLIGVAGAPVKWQIKVVDTASTITLDSIFTNPINYESGADIPVKMNQWVVLAAVDSVGKVKAYKNIQITQSTQLNPPLAAKLVSGLNYTTPKYGSVTGTTSVYVSLQGISGATEFVAKVVDSPVNIVAGNTIDYTAVVGSDYKDYHTYTSGADITAAAGQYLLLAAVDSSKNVLAYDNIQLINSYIRPGNAILLKTPENYSPLQPGAGVGTAKFTSLDFVGIPGTGLKWIDKVQDNDLTQVPLMDSSVEGASVYTANTDIPVKEGQYVVLYAVDSTGKIKGYINLQVLAANVRGIAPLLKLVDNYSAPEPGTSINTTKIATLTPPAGATNWKYSISDSPAGTILKDSLLTGLTAYTQGSDIKAIEGQHLILVATDASGYVKAYADITVTASILRNVEATLSGTAVTLPTGESNIVSGGRTISIQLKYGLWQDDVLTNSTKRNTLYDGLVASGLEQVQWGKVVAALKNEGMSAAVMNSTKDTITITLSEAPTYDITDNQDISLIIKPELIAGGTKSVTSTNSMHISANVIVQLDGTAMTQGLGEGDIVAGGRTIIIRLTNGQFALDVASNVNKRNAIFDGFKAANNPTEWAKVIQALKDAGDAAITRNASDKITISLPPVSSYNISMNETLSLTLPYQTSTGEEILTGAIKDVNVPMLIPVLANASAVMSGSLMVGNISESDIVTGSKQLVITLTDGQWVTDVASDATKRNALLSGLVTTTETTEWTKVINALKAAGEAAVKRTDNNTVTVTLPPVTGYNIASNQYVSLLIPAACISGAKANLAASNTAVIQRMASATLSGTATGTSLDETAIKMGGKTIVITLKDATWIDNITTDTAARAALFDGFTADVDTAQWAKVIANLKSGVGNVTKTAANIITITLPNTIDYDISAAQTISVTIPTIAVQGTQFNIPCTNTLVVNNTPPVATTVQSVGATVPAGVYKQGDTINIAVTFGSEVDVIGTPVLNLETGSVDRNAIYSTGSGTKTLIFVYNVQAGDYNPDLDYKATTSLVLTGATILNKGTSVKAITTLPAPGSTNSLSDTSNIKVDAVAPKFTTGYPKIGTKTETDAGILVKVDKKSKIYYVTVPNDLNNTTPTADQIMLGQNAAGVAQPSSMAGVLDTVENMEGTLNISGLTAYTAYTTYMVVVDDIQNKSAITPFNFTSADTTAPTFTLGYPKQSATIYDSKIDILIKADGLWDAESGKVYMVAVPVGSPSPSSTQVKAFKDANGALVAANLRATAAITKDTEIPLSLLSLPVSTTYDIYVVCEDAQGNLISAPAKVTANTSQLNLDNVGVDLAKKQLTNTTDQMQYSFDEVNWFNCTAGSTNITYDDNAEILVITIREKLNISNIRQLPILTRADQSIINTSLIDYDIAAKKITNTSAVNLQYRVNGGAWGTLNASGYAANVEFVPGLLEVRTAATSPTLTTDSKLPSLPVTVDNIAVPMPAPELTYDDSDNIVYGLDSTYEFSVNGGAWTTGGLDNIFPGTKTVKVRAKATKDMLPSAEQVIEFTAGTISAAAQPAALNTWKKNVVSITFEENTNKKALTAQNIRDWFLVGTWDALTGNRVNIHDWGTDFTTEWNTAGNVLTIVYNTMTGSTVKIGDEIRIDAAAGIKNQAGTSASYTSKGSLTGSFHTVPAIVSVKAENANNTIDFNNGDRIVITFDQLTKEPVITASNIDSFLKVTDSTGKINRTWGIVNNSDIVWGKTPDGLKSTLTITFNDVTATTLTLKDKVTVSPTLGLTDADGTTEACSSSSYISGSFTSTPKILSVVISNNGYAGTKNVNDTITITFDQLTNKKAITSSALVYYFKLLAPDGKTSHSWGVQSNIVWSTDGRKLTITITSTTGLTLASGDTLTLNPLAGIKAADGGTAACGDSKVITGGY